jgi:hypothetical protein
MNKTGRHEVVKAILVTFLFLPELVFLFLSIINLMIWQYFFKKRFNYKFFWLKQRSRYWYWREVESLDRSYLNQLREFGMPIKTSSKIATHVYVPVSERELPESEQTQFMFKDLQHSEAVTVSDQLYGISAEGGLDSIRAQTLAAKMTLKRMTGWKNLLDEHGNQIPFPSGNLAKLSLIVDELANAAPEIVIELERTFGSVDGKGRTDQ